MLGSGERMVKVDPNREIRIMTMILKKGNTKLLAAISSYREGALLQAPGPTSSI